jgi:acylglycerol lipase
MSKLNHTQGTFKGRSNIEISYQGWTAEKAKGIVILVHGIGEHSGRFGNIIDAMENKRISFYSMDNRGHGKSTGTRGHVDSFMEYVYDLRMFANMIHETHEDLPVFVLGHSLGGAIALRYALTYQNDIAGLILSAPALVSLLKPGFFMNLTAEILSSTFSSLTFSNRLDPAYLSHDEMVLTDYANDPLVHDRISPRLYEEIKNNSEFCFNHAFELNLPILIFHGTADRFIDISGSETLVREVSSVDKRFVPFQSLYHETMNEIPKERGKVLSLVASWIISHLSPASAVKDAKKVARPDKAAAHSKADVSAAKKKTVKKELKAQKAKPVKKKAR